MRRQGTEDLVSFIGLPPDKFLQKIQNFLRICVFAFIAQFAQFTPNDSAQ